MQIMGLTLERAAAVELGLEVGARGAHEVLGFNIGIGLVKTYRHLSAAQMLAILNPYPLEKS